MITKKGFTLIELLVVIAIIGVLTQVVIANMNDARKKSRDAKRISDVAQLQLTLEMYFDRCKAYPTTLTDLTGVVSCNGTNVGPFTNNLPVPPTGAGQTQYAYAALKSSAAATVCSSYHLGANLETRSHNGPLNDDVDAGASSLKCSTSANDFSGSDTGTYPMYDVKP